MTDSLSRTARRFAANPKALHAGPMLAIFVIVATSMALGRDLPEELVTRWGTDGGPDGTLSHEALILIDGFLALLIGHGLLALARNLRERSVARVAAAGALGVSALIAGLHWTTLAANAAAVTSGGSATLSAAGLGLTAVGVVVAAAVGWLLGPDGASTGPRELAVQELAIQPGEAVIWTGSSTAPRVLWALPGGMLVFGGLLLAIDEPLAATIVIGAAVLVLSTLRVRVSVGPAGMTIRFGPLTLLSRTVPLSTIQSVQAEHVDPLRYGGWGYRVVPGRRAVVLACGPGVRLVRHHAPDLLVTLPDAQVAAGVLRAHLDAARVG